MKVIAFNGSPKSNGNTAGSLKIVGEELIKEGIYFEIKTKVENTQFIDVRG